MIVQYKLDRQLSFLLHGFAGLLLQGRSDFSSLGFDRISQFLQLAEEVLLRENMIFISFGGLNSNTVTYINIFLCESVGDSLLHGVNGLVEGITTDTGGERQLEEVVGKWNA